MKKSTLILGLAFALILSYVLLIEKKHPPKTQMGSFQADKLFAFTANDIESLQITLLSQTLELKKLNDSHWSITKPIEAVGDPNQCANLADTIANLTPIASISQKEKISSYGIGKEGVLVRISLKSGKIVELRTGNDDPTHQGVYAYLPDDSKLVLVPSSFGQMLHQPVDFWKKHTPSPGTRKKT